MIVVNVFKEADRGTNDLHPGMTGREAGLAYPHAVLPVCLDGVQAHPHVLHAGSHPVRRVELLVGI